MANMLEKVFKKHGPKDKDKTSSRKLLKRLGIFSGLMWVGAMGAVFALNGFKLTPAETHGKADPPPEAEEQGLLADVPATPEDVHGHASHGTQSESKAAESVPADSAHREKHAHHGEGSESDDHHQAAPETDSPAEVHRKPGEAGEAISIVGPASQDERDALRELAEIHASRGDLEKAVYPLRKLMMAPTKDTALLSLATEVFLGTGHYPEAFAAAHKALRHSAPGRMDLRVSSILAQYRMGQVAEAFKQAETALKEYPKDLELLTAVGTMEIEMGPAHPRYGQSLEKALDLKPNHVPALYQVGRKAQLEGDYKDAETQFRKVLKRDPKHAKAHGQLGTALYHLKKDAQARKEFEAALALNPKDYNTWFNLGELHLGLAARERSPARIRGLRTKAIACYLKAVEWNPDHAEAHFRVGVILNGNGQYKEAIRHLEASRKSDTRHVPTLVQLAVAYENLKRPERAKAYLEKALELDPLDKIVLFKLKRLT